MGKIAGDVDRRGAVWTALAGEAGSLPSGMRLGGLLC